MNQIIQVAALLVVTLTTNEVKIGTATIGSDTFDVVGLQVVTNRVVTSKSIMHPDSGDWSCFRQESWTNSYPGPFIGTNLVKSASPVLLGTNVWGTNFIFGNTIEWRNASTTNVTLPAR